MRLVTATILIAVSALTRLPVLPDVLPFAEASGAADFEAVSWHMLLAPAKTPREIVVKLNQEILRALADPEVKERLALLGADIVASSPEQTAAIFKADLAKYTKVAQAANIRAD